MDTTFNGKDASLKVWTASSNKVDVLIKASEVSKDLRIKPYAKKTWKRRKKHIFRAVYHMDTRHWVQLADLEMPEVEISKSADYTLGRSKIPYLRSMSWSRYYYDYYAVNLKTGKRKQVAGHLRYRAKLSPGGKFVLYYQDKDWFLYNIAKGVSRNLTANLEVSFSDEDYDRPQISPGYGVAGWTSKDGSVLIYDKYDIWKFSTTDTTARPVNLTKDGRKRLIQYRIKRLHHKKESFREDEKVLVRGYYCDHKKTYGIYTLSLGNPGVELQLETPHKYKILAKAENSDRILYSRESYDEYPNLWVSEGMNFDKIRRVTNRHLNLHKEYNWGRAELIDWVDMDGHTLRGALIKPDDYEEGKRYPVLVYLYERYSYRAYEFNRIVNDDRPTLPQWVSDDYVVFLPDIHYETGTPGPSATKSLMPGVLKLIEMGIADTGKIGLHGHSWGGYETAFIITRTDIFNAAIAGAPVGNMTSAYSGIRWGSGLARQVQYETGQSRLGGSLWEYPERYIENSPVFFADRIHTPLLIMSGDEDTAVPWYQDIELYLAMVRLGKDCIFLQYHGEPHHLQKYANRLDYAIKMKQYFDHYLKGKDAPEWMKEGIPYQGK